jgi:hypothetical protein
MKPSSADSSDRNSSSSAFTGWGVLIGLALGAGIGLLTGRMLTPVVSCGVIGLVVGALLDRRRR